MQLTDKNDIKIFILYLLYNLSRPMEFSDINDVVVQDEVVSSFDFAECFAELIDVGNVIEVKNGTRSEYVISEKGKQIALNLESDLLSTIKTRGIKNALRLLSYKERGCSIESNYEIRADGKFDLTLTIKDANQLSLEIKVVAENVEMLEKMRSTFSERPEIVYRGTLALLTGEVDYLLS